MPEHADGLPLEWSPAALMDEAAGKSGLDDWGHDLGFTEPLQLLLESCVARGRLTPAGWQVLRSVLLRHLRNRLHLQAYLTRRPEALHRPLHRPVVVTGLPRTGTTLLHGLLAQDRRHRFLRLWEALHPVPPEESSAGSEAALVGQAERWLERFYAHSPDFRVVHPLSPHGPEECDRLLQNAFASQHLVDMFDVPAYARWFYEGVLRREYAYYALQLQVLTRDQETDRPWLLKSPGHLPHLDELLEVLPDAVVLHCHRDPVEAVPSYASLILTVRSPNTDGVSPRVVGDQALQRCAHMMDRARRARRRVGEHRVLDVSYPQLVDDPIGTVHRIHDWLGTRLGADREAALRRWLHDTPRHQHGVHRYDPQEFGLPADRVQPEFAEYYRRFGAVVRD